MKYQPRGQACLVQGCQEPVKARGTCNRHYRRNRVHGDVNTVLPKRRLPTHGGSRSPEYAIWNLMRQRCSNPKKQGYENYGGRGVTVCERWNDFASFLADMGPRPSPRHSIDRIDNNKGYAPDNCRWATPEEQHRNRRDNKYVEYMGVTHCVSDWAQMFSISTSALNCRLRRGWSMERALNRPVRSNGRTPHR